MARANALCGARCHAYSMWKFICVPLGKVGTPSYHRPMPIDLPAFHAVEVTVHDQTSCARSDDGRVACWGAHVLEGVPTLNEGASGVPRVLDGITDAQQVLLADLGLVVRTSDAVWVVDLYRDTPPKKVDGLGVVTKLVAADGGVCALQSDGTVGCFGWMRWFPEGTTPHQAHVATGIGGATDLVCDTWACCVETAEGHRCFGDRGPVGEVEASRAPPGRIMAWPAGRLVMGFDRGCAVTDDRVMCWGRQVQVPGKGGDDLPDYGEGPHQIDGTDVILHYDDACVRQGDRWHCDDFANGAVQLDDVVQLAMDHGHGCATHKKGSVTCWGRNDQGQLGDGRRIFDPQPQKVAEVSGATDLTAAYSSTCVRSKDRLMCWGDEAGTPSEVSDVPNLGSAMYLAAFGWRGSTLLYRHYEWGAWESETFRPAPFEPSHASLDRAHNLCVADQANIQCLYSLGEGGFADQWKAMKGPTAPVAQLVPTAVGLLVLAEDGTVWTWEDDRFEGDPDFVKPPRLPQKLQQVDGIIDAVRIAAGQDARFVQLKDGRVLTRGQVGWDVSGPATFTDFPAFAGATDLDANDTHICAVVDGVVWCYGSNDLGQCGQPVSRAVPEPKPVALPEPAVAVAVGQDHSCAVVKSRDVYCWGADEYGALGRGRVLKGTGVRVHGLGPRR